MVAVVSILGLALLVGWPFGLLLWLLNLRDQPSTGAYDESVADWLAARRKLPQVRRRLPDPPDAQSPVWPITVLHLARALASGADCSFALHDALLEAGHDDLAERMRELTDEPTAIARMILGQ